MAQHITQLNKYISESKKITRRAADRLIDEGQVQINGRLAKGADKVFFGDEVHVENELLPLYQPEQTVLLAYNKPVQVDGAASPKGIEELAKLIKHKTQVYVIGRLGSEAQGLLLLTNNELLANRFNKHLVAKIYAISVAKQITPAFLEKLGNGVEVLGRQTEKCAVQATGENSFTITLTDEINKQIAQMCELFGNTATEIKRVQVANLTLGDLEIGEYSELSAAEIEAFEAYLAQSVARKMEPIKKTKPPVKEKPKVKVAPRERDFEEQETPRKPAKPVPVQKSAMPLVAIGS